MNQKTRSPVIVVDSTNLSYTGEISFLDCTISPFTRSRNRASEENDTLQKVLVHLIFVTRHRPAEGNPKCLRSVSEIKIQLICIGVRENNKLLS